MSALVTTLPADKRSSQSLDLVLALSRQQLFIVHQL